MPPFGDGGDLFYDDNEWVALEKIQHRLVFGDESSLAHAEQIFALIQSAWSTDASLPSPGGLYWMQSPTSGRNTCANMPAAAAAARLYTLTRKQEYLDWAKKIYAWTAQTLKDSDGLYFDNIAADGTIEQTKWSYNQGMPIAAGVALYQATRDRRYLQDAITTAQASYKHYVTLGELANQPIYFNSIYFKSTLLLSSVTGDTRYYAAMSDYADDLWAHNRDVQTGLLWHDKQGETQALEQGAAIQIFAVVGWSPSRWSVLY